MNEEAPAQEERTIIRRGQGRESLLNAAVELMLSDRLRAVTHRNVAEAAGVSIGLIRYHFQTSAALLLAGVERIMANRHEGAKEALKECSPSLNSLECGRLIVKAYSGPDTSDRGLAAMLGCLIDSTREDASLAEFLLSEREVVEDDVRNIVEACGRDTALVPVLPHVVDGALIAGMIDKQEGLLDMAATSCAVVLDLAD